MPEAPRLVRIPTLKSASDFHAHVASLKINLPCDSEILTGSASPLAAAVPNVTINGKPLRNRFAVQPMEGWDGTPTGRITDDVRHRWRRFGESGAKLICGGEAMAIRPDGRANPKQLIISEQNKADFSELRDLAASAHKDRFGTADDLVIGFQLTHSGRFCRPNDHGRPEPRVAYRHPLLDGRSGVTADAQVFSDAELEALVNDYVKAAAIAWEVGADFVDIKHCHGYLLHEFLSAFERPGSCGGCFENRTRLLREIVGGIRRTGNRIDLAVRLSAFDLVPFRPDPALSSPGRPGPGVPEDFSKCLPYRWGFGTNEANPLEPDLAEACKFATLCVELGIKILNLTAGSPYYNPHIQRPAAYPPSDGYLPPEDPLIGVARQINAVRQVKSFLDQNASGKDQDAERPLATSASAQRGKLVLVGSAYSYLQEYLPHVAQAVLRLGWTDLVGVGRMVLSYPGLLTDALATGCVNGRLLCRTFSDCTTAPRNGLVSGCYPLDSYYAQKPEAKRLKELKAKSRSA